MVVYPVGGTSSAASPSTPEGSGAVPRVDGAPEAVDLLDAMNTGHPDAIAAQVGLPG